MTTYNKTKSGSYLADQLQAEINVHPGIVPSCTSVVARGTSLTVVFAAALGTTGSPSEEDILDQIILDHVPVEQSIDVAQLPRSDLDNEKLSVHPSYKPNVPGKTTYAVWTGSGDDLSSSPPQIGKGPLLDFHMETQTGSPLVTQIVEKRVEFAPEFGGVWIHEGYMRFENGGHGDFLCSEIQSYATALQTQANLTLYVDGDWVKYAIGSPNPATHGFAGTPVLVPRTFSNDGDWDYDGTNLTPNLAGTGEYKISTKEQVVHRYFNRIPACGSSPYFSFTSDETAYLPPGFFIVIRAHNASNTAWDASIMLEIYRERTFQP